MCRRPPRHLLDEVEHAVVGPVDVLEHHDRGAPFGNPLEEGAPCAEQFGAVDVRDGSDPEEPRQRRLDPFPLVAVGDVLGQRRTQLGAGLVVVVGLRDTAALSHHLGQRPEGHAVAVGRGATGVVVHVLTQTVDVDEKLVGETALADPALADNRDEPRPALGAGGVEHVLEDPHLVLASHERGDETLGAARSTASGDDPQCAECLHRQLLALHGVLTERGELDGGPGQIGRGPTDHDGAGLGDSL